MSRTLFTNARVFDGSGAAPFPGEVLVEGTRIAAVARLSGPEAALPRDGAEVVDGRAGTLLPGLVEPHGHLSFPDALTWDDFDRMPPEDMTLRAMHNARIMLECGYTSCLSAASARPRIDVVIRNEIDAGRIPGPRLLANGPEITVTGGLGDGNRMHRPLVTNSTFSLVVDGPDEMRRACRTLVREGVDLLKLNLSGDEGLPYAGPEATVMSREEAAAAVAVAEERGKRICVHARGAGAVKLALSLGIDIVYHANHLDEEALDLLEAARDRVFVVPALGVGYFLMKDGARFGVTPEWCRSAGIDRQIAASVEGVPKMRKRGVRVLPGGDYGFAWNPHGAYARELWLFVEVLGVPPAETLAAATSMGGAIMGRGHELGQVKAGFLADLVLVDGDPLADIAILQDPARLRAVMKDGRFAKAPSA